MSKCRAKTKPCKSGSRCPDATGSTASNSNPAVQSSVKGSSTNPAPVKGRGVKAELAGFGFMESCLPEGFGIDSTGSNSSKSDLEVFNDKGISQGFIEVKQLPSAAGGQIVVAKDGNDFISKNRNPYTPEILKFVNRHETSAAADLAVISLSGSEEQVVWNWMNSHWQGKKVIGFYLTDEESSYEKFVAFNKLRDEVSLILNKPRPKRSGTGGLSQADRLILPSYFSTLWTPGAFGLREDAKKMFIKPAGTPELYHTVSGKTFFLSEESKHIQTEGEFEVKRRATTNNLNVLIQLALKGKKESTSPQDVKEFFKTVR